MIGKCDSKNVLLKFLLTRAKNMYHKICIYKVAEGYKVIKAADKIVLPY